MKRVAWQYRHSTGRASFQRIKEGVYFGQIRHTVKHWRKSGAVQMALVQFDGNKRASKVPLHQLRFINEEGKKES